MKSDGPMKHFILAFVLAAICYVVLYNGIEHRRIKKGPWEMVFNRDQNGTPILVINQPNLAITNVQINFPTESFPATNKPATLLFAQPQAVPYDVPFGKCIFIDTTFLPGTVTLQLFGHEVQLLPRVLIIDHQEHPWLSESTNTVHSFPELHNSSTNR